MVNDRVTELEKKDEVVTEAVLKNSDRLSFLEIDARKKNILIKGIELHQEARNYRETRQQTEECIQWFLDAIDCQVKPANCIRFTPTKRAIETAQKTKRKVAPIIKIECLTDKAKAGIFSKLAENGRKPEIRGITLTNDYPPFLKEVQANLDKVAYNIRKESNNAKKTKIVLKGNTLVLLVDGKEHKVDSTD